MSTSIERENSPKPTLQAPLSPKRRVSLGEVEQRFTRGRSKTVVVEAARRRSPIRAWRAPETGTTQPVEQQQDRTSARADTGRSNRPFARDLATGMRLNEAERAARTRAIEQAWKEERARQSEREAEEQRRAEAAATQQAEEQRRQAEAKRDADERARLALEQAKRFRTKARASTSDGTGASERDKKKRASGSMGGATSKHALASAGSA